MYRPISDEEQQMMSYHFQKPRPQDLPDLPENDPLAREWKTYKREVVRLLAVGHVGRHALIRCDTVHSIWDTSYDAYQAGCLQFGLEAFMIQEIQAVIQPVRWGYSHLCQS